MHIPRYWAQGINPLDGRTIWRSSSNSEQEAQLFVKEVLAVNENRKINGGLIKIVPDEKGMKSVSAHISRDYPIGTGQREKLLREYPDTKGETSAFLTRNTVGSLVWNFRDLMVLDWDYDDHYFYDGCLFAPLKCFFSALKNIFELLKGRNKKQRYEPSGMSRYGNFDIRNNNGSNPDKSNNKTDRKQNGTCDVSCGLFENWPHDLMKSKEYFQKLLKPVWEYVDQHADWQMRFYLTAGGMRAIAVHAPFRANDESVQKLMTDFRCDPDYIRFCRYQQCFRARVTPKGWRCGFRYSKVAPKFRFRYPWPNDDKEMAKLYEKGIALYEMKTRQYAVCRYLGSVGTGKADPVLLKLVELHDETALTSQEFRESPKELRKNPNEFKLA